MVTAALAFLKTPWGRGIATVAGVILVALAILAWDRARIQGRVDAAVTEAVAVCNADWRSKLKEAEDAARDNIRRKEAAAYQRAVDDERARAEADAKDQAEAETIIREVIRVSEPAAACRYDDASVRALNRLREP